MPLQRLARFCYHRRRYVLVAWLLGLVLVTGLSKTAGGKSATNFTLPGTESQRAFDLLKQNFPARSGDTADIVFAADGPQGVRAPAIEQRMNAAFAAAQSASRHVSGVTSPYSAQGARQVSADGHIAFAEIQFDVRSNDLPRAPRPPSMTPSSTPSSRVPASRWRSAAMRSPPVVRRVAPSSSAWSRPSSSCSSPSGRSWPWACPSSSPSPASVIGLGLIGLLANFMQVVSFTSLIAAMIGIGVGIDYALFIVTRYRQGLHDGLRPGDAVATAITTSGRAVLLAGSTVVIALMGMFVMGLSFINGLAVGSALAVLITMFASVTLLPAMLGFVGRNIDKFHVPALHRSAAARPRPAERSGIRWSRPNPAPARCPSPSARWCSW